MPTDITSNSQDLDNIFISRINSKRPDVGYTVNGVDISNRYEAYNGTKTTGYLSNGIDIGTMFRSVDDVALAAIYSVVSESWSNYAWNDDGYCSASIVSDKTFAIPVSGQYKFIFDLLRSNLTVAATTTVTIAATGPPTGSATFGGLNSDFSGAIRITDDGSGKSITTPLFTIGYNIGQHIANSSF